MPEAKIQAIQFRRFIVLIAFMSMIGQVVADERNGSLKAVIDDAYRRYAWESVFSVDSQNFSRLPLTLEKLSILQEFFAPDLAAALKADAQCAKKSREICSLDFDILYDSQDPSATDLVIKSMQSDRVEVCFSDQTKHRTCLEYIGDGRRKKPRIADIIYRDGRSLRMLLGLKRERY